MFDKQIFDKNYTLCGLCDIGMLMPPFILQNTPGHALDSGESPSSEAYPHSWAMVLKEFWRDVLQVWEQKVFVLACGAYTLYVAVLGVYAYW
jgi:hypothetical protein